MECYRRAVIREQNFEGRSENLNQANKLVAHWASQKLGLAGAAVDDYVKQVLAADLDNPETDGVFKKIRKDFDAAGVVQSDSQIRLAMDQFLSQAFVEIKAGR